MWGVSRAAALQTGIPDSRGFMGYNPAMSDMNDLIGEILAQKTIAVVGLSPRPDRPSYQVAEYLKDAGYRIVPVNPAVEEVLGEKSYPDLRSVPGTIDVVDVFRRPSDVMPVVEDAIEAGAGYVWMQEGIVNEAAAEKAEAAGIPVVMDLCIKKEHESRLG